jgi:hypothetical protein
MTIFNATKDRQEQCGRRATRMSIRSWLLSLQFLRTLEGSQVSGRDTRAIVGQIVGKLEKKHRWQEHLASKVRTSAGLHA